MMMEEAKGGPWTREEFERLHQALGIFPEGEWKDIAKYIGTRTPQQVQAYYQKYRDAVTKRQGHRRRRSWEEGMQEPNQHERGFPSHSTGRPNYFHQPPSLARPVMPSPRHGYDQRGTSSPPSVESMYNSVLDQFPGTNYRDKLINFYYKHNPSKVNEVDHILGLFRNRELRLFLNLSLKYQLSQSMPQELISQRLRTIRSTTPKNSQDENLRMLSNIVPPPQTFHDTRPLQFGQMQNGTISPNSNLPTLRSYIAPTPTNSSAMPIIENGSSWATNEPQSYQV